MANCIAKKGAPTIETVGYVGQRYVDIDTCDIYECKAIDTLNYLVDGPVYPNEFVNISHAAVPDIIYIWEKIRGGESGGGMFEVEVDWDTETVITPLNDIRDAWLAHKMVVMFGSPFTDTIHMFVFSAGVVYDEGSEHAGDFFAASFVNVVDGHVNFYHISNDGSVTYDKRDVEMTEGR